MNTAENHFNQVAKNYDFWKKKNYYYYDHLIQLFRLLIGQNKKIVEIGCGTGNILASLDPTYGLGIDVSSEMIEIAQNKFLSNKNLEFICCDILNSNQQFNADYILLADVLEHISQKQAFLNCIYQRMAPSTEVIISLINPIWEPFLLIAEKLGMKMPEGPHQRNFVSTTEKMFKNAGFRIKDKGYRLLIPKKIIGADWINQNFYRWPLLKRFSFITYWVLIK